MPKPRTLSARNLRGRIAALLSRREVRRADRLALSGLAAGVFVAASGYHHTSGRKGIHTLAPGEFSGEWVATPRGNSPGDWHDPTAPRALAR